MATSASGDDNDIQARPQQSPLASQRAKQQGKKVTYFPMGYKEGFSQWWASITPANAESKVLSFMPFIQKPSTHHETGSAPPSTTASATNIASGSDVLQQTPLSRQTSVGDPYGPRKWHSSLVKLDGENRALNEFTVERVGEEVENTLVMLHGYGAGLGFFFNNFEPLSRLPHWRLYALDLLGMGRSSRPPFRIHAKDRQGKITEAENWFVDALEEWRIQRKIERFTLLGHSLGGYMAVAYALKYPGRLNKLILASPVGIPEDPYAVNESLPDPNDSSIQAEFSQDQSETATTHKTGTASTRKTEEPQRRRMPKWLTYAWDANISPFSLIRWSGPLGPRLVSGWTSRRFSQLPADQAQALHDYAYSLFRQRGSGEYALAYILAPGAFARSPLIRRIGSVGRQWVPIGEGRTRLENGVPVVFLYGENDWMDVTGGLDAKQKLKEAKQKVLETASPEERVREQGDAKVLIVKGAGHHVYLDGHEEFNEMITQEMRDVDRRERIRRSWTD